MSAILVDSAVYIDLLRAQIDIRQRLLPFMRAGDLYNCGVVRAEVLRGVKTARIHDGLRDFYDIIPEVPCDAKLWREVSELAWTLQRQGKSPPVTDLAIAVCALRVDARLVSPDAHFQDIPGLTVLTELP